MHHVGFSLNEYIEMHGQQNIRFSILVAGPGYVVCIVIIIDDSS